MTSSIILLLVAVLNICNVLANDGVHLGAFESGYWIPDTTEESRNPKAFHVLQHAQLSTKFIVALNHRDVDKLKQNLLDVSMPRSGSYGKHLSISEIKSKYSPRKSELQKVVAFFSQIEGSIIEVNKIGSMLSVRAPLQSIENGLNTKLGWFKHSDDATPKRSLKAILPLNIPVDIQNIISFISLNSPVSHNVRPKRIKSKVPNKMSDLLNKKETVQSVRDNNANQDISMKRGMKNIQSESEEDSADYSPPQHKVFVTEGNKEVRKIEIKFKIYESQKRKFVI